MSYSYKGILVTNIIQQNGTTTYSPEFGATSPGVALPQALPSQYTIDLVNDNPTYKYANIGAGNISVYAPNGTNVKGSIANTAIYNSTSNNVVTSYNTSIPVGCKNITYWLVGGGGGGGGSGGAFGAYKAGNGGSGGIGGYYAPASPFLNSTTGQTTYNITVGNQGNGGNAGSNSNTVGQAKGGDSGNNGGSSTFTIGATLLGTANGGNGGGNSSGANNGNTNSGGPGGAGTPGAPANVGTEYYPRSNYGLQGNGGGSNAQSGKSGSGGYAQVFYFYN